MASEEARVGLRLQAVFFFKIENEILWRMVA